jgi:hypothetical protein
MRGYALAIVLAAVGCQKPYQAEATAIGTGKYMIRAQAETESSEEVAYQRAYERAKQVCPAGYEVVDNKAGATRTYRRVAEGDTAEVTLVVQCGPPAAGSPGAQ